MSLEDLPPSLSPEEAELLAAKITPSWEAPPMVGGAATEESTVSYQTPLVPPMHAETEPKLVAAEIRREAGARLPLTSDLPTSPRTPEGVKDVLTSGASAAVPASAQQVEAEVDPTVRMPSLTEGLSDSDIVAAEPAIPGPPKTPAGIAPPLRKALAPTANMIPYVPEGDRRAPTMHTRSQEDDDIPESSIRGGSRGLVLMVVGLVAVVAFGGVFFALRGSSATSDTAAGSASSSSSSKYGVGMVQPASSKGDVPAPETLPDSPAASAGSASSKVASAGASGPPSTPPSTKATPPAVPVSHFPSTSPKGNGNGGGSAGSSGHTKPPNPATTGGKPGGIVRDNPF